MPTVVTRSVKSSGGDYTSLASAEAGEQSNLVTDDVQLDIACYAFQDTDTAVINGWTTDATHYIRIFTATGEGHSGVWSTSKYRISFSASAFGRCMDISEEFVRVEGLQFEHTNATPARAVAVFGTANAAGSDIRFDRILIRGSGGGTGVFYVDSGKVTIRNSTIYGVAAAATSCIYMTFGANAPTVIIDNCTLAASTAYGIDRVSGTVTVQNVYSGGHTTDAYNGTMTRTTCMHDTATSFTGSTGSTAFSTANFTNVTGGSEDLHITSGSALKDAGTDLSGTFTNDIDSETRSAPFDVGADEIAGATSTVKILVRCCGGQPYLVTPALVR